MSGKKKFPEGFLWGAATASYQVEGGIDNTDWARAAREGRVPPAGESSDHYHRYEEDFDIAKSLGHNAHRFSIEWARIEPEEGKFDQKETEHYRVVIQALKARGLKPYTTLWHFTLPNWFAESGGFERHDASKIFARYARYIVQELGSELEGITTMNEPTVYTSNGWRRGTWPPFKKWIGIQTLAIAPSKNDQHASRGSIRNIFLYYKVLNTLAQAHRAAYHAMKEIAPHLEISLVKHIVLFRANTNPLNTLMAWYMNYHWTHSFMRKVVRDVDAIGLNYYIQKKFGDTRTYEKTDMNWDIYPEGIYDCLMMLKRYRKPLFVSEAGIADAQDIHRTDYIQRQVQAVWQAIQDGAPVRGHMYWSLLDNYEWAEGYEKRFGLVEINYETKERTIRQSAYAYKKICEENAVEG